MKRTSILIIILTLLVGIVLYSKFGANTRPTITSKDGVQEVKKINALDKMTCTRTTRLENAPQYDRALSFIQQRLSENQKRFKHNERALFVYFPPELTNCIKIIEKTPDKSYDYEGYFAFNGKDTKSDYFPIIVNSKYLKADDILIALLLTHEMTHVQQYIDYVNDKTTKSCIDKEVDAFLATQEFYSTVLNFDEMLIVFNRIGDVIEDNKSDVLGSIERPFENQLLMLETVQNLNSSELSNCKKPEFKNGSISDEDWEDLGKYTDCRNENDLTPILLKNILENDDAYKRQCEL